MGEGLGAVSSGELNRKRTATNNSRGEPAMLRCDSCGSVAAAAGGQTRSEQPGAFSSLGLARVSLRPATSGGREAGAAEGAGAGGFQPVNAEPRGLIVGRRRKGSEANRLDAGGAETGKEVQGQDQARGWEEGLVAVRGGGNRPDQAETGGCRMPDVVDSRESATVPETPKFNGFKARAWALPCFRP